MTEEWREIAIAEVEQLRELLSQADFTAADLGDRLAGLLEYIALQPKDNHQCN